MFNKYVPALLSWQITQMSVKFAAKVLRKTAKCRQLLKKNAEIFAYLQFFS